MSERFPDLVDPVNLAVTGRQISGELQPAQMKRLLSLLYSDKGVVRVEVEFGVDSQGIRFVKGHLDAEVEVACQRCLEAVGLEVSTDFQLGIVTSDTKAGNLPSDYEPLLVETTPMPLPDIIEDELILTIPIVAMHAEGDCSEEVKKVLNESVEIEETAEEKKSPFSVLEELKVKK